MLSCTGSVYDGVGSMISVQTICMSYIMWLIVTVSEGGGS